VAIKIPAHSSRFSNCGGVISDAGSYRDQKSLAHKQIIHASGALIVAPLSAPNNNLFADLIDKLAQKERKPPPLKFFFSHSRFMYNSNHSIRTLVNERRLAQLIKTLSIGMSRPSTSLGTKRPDSISTDRPTATHESVGRVTFL
jgi:hypothetical protein